MLKWSAHNKSNNLGLQCKISAYLIDNEILALAVGVCKEISGILVALLT